MAPASYIVATAGHVDHGKSSLVRALTGTDPDRLPEEKARGITIDLGFAHLRLDPPAGPRGAYSVGIVDVPGHEDFIKNMVAGLGSVDLALLVVAADDLWKPQTEEHLQILAYMGVTRAVVALTKVDLIASPEAAMAAVRRKLGGSPFAGAEVVGTSVVAGVGLEALKAALAAALSQTPPRRDVGKPRLPVDRAFALRGVGTVVTGTLAGGRFHRGQTVAVQPGAKAARVRGVQSHGRDVESCPPGSRAALHLAGVAVVGGHAAAGEAIVRRGDVIAATNLGSAHDTLDVRLERSARIGGEGVPPPPRLADGATVHLHLSSTNYAAKLILWGEREVSAGGAALAQLRLDEPAYAFAGDRFVLRDASAQHTLAGGVVLDPDATRRSFHAEGRGDFLSRRAEDASAATWVETLLQRDGAAPRLGLLAKSFFSDAEVSEGITALERAGNALVVGEAVVAAAPWHALLRTAGDAILADHAAHPESQGLKLAELRPLLEKELSAVAQIAGVFDGVITALLAGGYVRAAAVIRAAGHRPGLPAHLRAAGERLRASLAAEPYEPPSRKELSRDAAAEKALHFLIETGEAVVVGEEVVMLADALAEATALARQYINANGPATASQLRQALGTTRRIMMPLVEYWDRHGVTLRRGDVRVLK